MKPLSNGRDTIQVVREWIGSRITRKCADDLEHRARLNRLEVESLEERCMLAANLTVTDAYLIDGNMQKISSPVAGEVVAVRVNWDTQDLPGNISEYEVRFLVDGVQLRSDKITSGAGYSSNDYWRYRSGWYAKPGKHNVSVKVDVKNTVKESNERDNVAAFSFTTKRANLREKFSWPLNRVAYRQVAVSNYNDLDPTKGVKDYRGGNASYDGHNAIDIALGNFQQMDKGVRVLAAASGRVKEIHDGEFDRETVWKDDAKANYVIIDHGTGWETFYWHLRRDSVRVKVGDPVRAGKQLGLVGSSGISDGAHLHFGATHHGRSVEPFLDANSYWKKPIAYTGDKPYVYLSGVTNYNPAKHFQEGPSELPKFAQKSNQRTYVWARFSGLRKNDRLKYQWYQPNGSRYLASSRKINADYSNSRWWFVKKLPANPAVGKWRVEFLVNGKKLGQQVFRVTPNGNREIRVEDLSGNLILNNRTTPVDFGNSTPNSTGKLKWFRVVNHGDYRLLLKNVVVPKGFELVTKLPKYLDPGKANFFSVRIKTTTFGRYSGLIRIVNNDPDESNYRFAVTGTVGHFS